METLWRPSGDQVVSEWRPNGERLSAAQPWGIHRENARLYLAEPTGHQAVSKLVQHFCGWVGNSNLACSLACSPRLIALDLFFFAFLSIFRCCRISMFYLFLFQQTGLRNKSKVFICKVLLRFSRKRATTNLQSIRSAAPHAHGVAHPLLNQLQRTNRPSRTSTHENSWSTVPIIQKFVFFL